MAKQLCAFSSIEVQLLKVTTVFRQSVGLLMKFDPCAAARAKRPIKPLMIIAEVVRSLKIWRVGLLRYAVVTDQRLYLL
jgi:hypothetical protein